MLGRRSLNWFLFLAFAACHAQGPQQRIAAAPVITNTAPPPQKTDIDSQDVIERTAVESSVQVMHILIGWAELERAYGGRLDPRAAKRTQADAAKLTETIAAQLRSNRAALATLTEKHSEDPGSIGGEPYVVETESPFVPPFKSLALRLQVNEIGIVESKFGYHVMIRVAPPAPDPLESADILARTAVAAEAEVQHIVIGWKGLTRAFDSRAKARTKDEADALAKEIFGKVRAGGDMPALMKQYSEDVASQDNGRSYTVDSGTPMVEPFKQLALRLTVGEAGLVKTIYGWHIVKRVPPPPLDPLESAEILNRTTVAEKVKVKHILLGWKDTHAEDPRGAARTRAELERLVKATVAKLAKKKAKIEKLMAELSEDAGSAKSGIGYDVTPDAGLVKPFLTLSLRLKLNEIGVVKTDFGIHIIQRIE